jgi:hypothetical protein
MKWTFRYLTLLGLFITAIPAIAAENVRVDNSEVYVWGFLGICAVIVVAQLYPILRDALKGVGEEEAERKTVRL